MKINLFYALTIRKQELYNGTWIKELNHTYGG